MDDDELTVCARSAFDAMERIRVTSAACCAWHQAAPVTWTDLPEFERSVLIAGLEAAFWAKDRYREDMARAKAEKLKNTPVERMLINLCKRKHAPVQHSDREPPWCDHCGYSDDYVYRRPIKGLPDS